MKKNTNSSKKWLASICALSLLALLSSCLKNNYNTNVPPVALVTFVQASPDQPALDFYLDNNRVNAFGVNFGDHIDYFRAFTGTRAANFFNAGTTTKIFSNNIQLTENNYYSLFLAGKAAQPETVLLTDTLNQPAAGNASIRFINLSPDAPAVDLVLVGGTTLVANKPYKGFSSFTPIPMRANATLEVHQAGTSTVLATLSNVNLNSGSVYTIWLQGLATPTGTTDKLSIGIEKNAFFF